MPLYNVYNNRNQRLGCYAAKNPLEAKLLCERDIVAGGSRMTPLYVKLAADDKQGPR